MLSRLKRRTPSATYPDSPSSPLSPPAADTAPSTARSPDRDRSPTPSTRSTTARSYTTPVKPPPADRSTLSPTRAYRSPSSVHSRTSRSSSFGSFADDHRTQSIGEGSLSLDHLALPDGHAHGHPQNLTLVVQAPELLVDSASSTAGSPASHGRDSLDTPTDAASALLADLRTPLAAHEPLFAPLGHHAPAPAAPSSRPRSHTSSEAVRAGPAYPVRAPRISDNGLDALAAINVAPTRSFTAPSLPTGSAISSTTVSPPSMSRTSSRNGTSRPASRSSSIASQQYPDHLSLRPPSSSSTGVAAGRSFSPVRGRKPSPSVSSAGMGGISGALASPSANLRHPHALVPPAAGDGERAPLAPPPEGAGAGAGAPPSATPSLASARTSLESHMAPMSNAVDDSDGQGSVYRSGGGEHAGAFLSMDQLGDFDDVVSQLGTGYAVASSKRNAEFHALFKNVPDDDYLIEDYGCALQREILIQGRLYISEHHLSFYANIFGWVTSVVIPFSEVCSIEKRMTAYVIPNAIQVATMHARVRLVFEGAR
ncbi:hypothetical protein JCM3770_007145 [Rhodotorula araucariae]